MDTQTVWQLIFTPSQIATFFWIFLAGAGLTLIFFIFGEIFDGAEDVLHNLVDLLHLDSIFDIDPGTGSSILSPRVISVFVTVFGGSGFLASVQLLGPIASSLIGIASGTGIAGIFLMAFRWIHNQQSSSVLSNSQLVGKPGTVKTEIPENGVGEVIVDYVGSRITRPAKSNNGSLIGTNVSIVVQEVRGQMLIVAQQK